MIPLSMADVGQPQIIKKIGGNLIVRIKESRVAISKDMAGKIMV